MPTSGCQWAWAFSGDFTNKPDGVVKYQDENPGT